jgi:hypothetical protein
MATVLVEVHGTDGETNRFSFESLLDAGDDADSNSEGTAISNYVNNDIMCDCVLEEGFESLRITRGDCMWEIQGGDLYPVSSHVGRRVQIPPASEQTTATAYIDLEASDGDGGSDGDVVIAQLLIDSLGGDGEEFGRGQMAECNMPLGSISYKHDGVMHR